jgi:hypothetical protein
VEALAKLIDDHRAAYDAFIVEVERNEDAKTPSRAYWTTDRAERRALLAVCAYRCRTLEDAKVKAEYLLKAPSLKGTMADRELALLQSFIGKEAA